MSWFLYLIECADGSVYTGIAVDVEARYAAHCSGKGARYTRSHPPRRLLYSAAFADRSAASRAEYAVKQLPAGRKRALVEALLAGRLVWPEGGDEVLPRPLNANALACA